MSDAATTIIADPGRWLEGAGVAGLLLVGLIGLAWVLRSGVKIFMSRIDRAEAKCDADNKALRDEIVKVRQEHAAALAGIVLESKVALEQCAAAMHEMTEIAKSMRDETRPYRKSAS